MTTEDDKSTTQVEMTERVPSASGPPPHALDEPSIWRLALQNWKILLYCCVANIGPMIFGYDVIAVSAVAGLPAFQKVYGSPFHNKTILPALWQGLWSGFLQLGTLIGAFGNGYFQDQFGRRAPLILGGVLSAAGAGLTFSSADLPILSHKRIAFMFGKMLIGMGIGVLLSGCQTYISEIAPKRLRGFLLGIFAFVVSIGHLVSISVVFAGVSNLEPSAFKVLFASQWAFSGFCFVAYFILPESPSWLCYHGKYERAAKEFRRLNSPLVDTDTAINDIKATIEHEKIIQEGSKSPTYLDCFKGVDLRRTRIVILLNFLKQLIGITLLINSTYFLIMAGMSSKQTLMINQIGIALIMIANFISWFTISTLGRRTILLVSTITIAVSWLAMGIAGCFSTDTARWFIGIALLLFGFFNGLGVGSAVPVLTSEINSVRLRSKGTSIGWGCDALFSWIFGFFVPYLFNSDELNWGGKIGFFFFGLSIIGVVLIWLEIPETKGKSYYELDYLFEMKTKTRAFRHAVVRQDIGLSKEDVF